jgi:hypothetical protein
MAAKEGCISFSNQNRNGVGAVQKKWATPSFINSAEGTIVLLIRSFWPASGPKTALKREFGAFGRAIGAWGCLKVSFQTAPNWINNFGIAFGKAIFSVHLNMDWRLAKNVRQIARKLVRLLIDSLPHERYNPVLLKLPLGRNLYGTRNCGL